jgi:NAD(P)-dependent dehydrogenase (short-subunit alcohol dehydrogenase family)
MTGQKRWPGRSGPAAAPLVIRADVSNRSAVDEMVSQAVAEYGHIDILVNNAGVNIYQPFLEIEQRVWDLTMGIDLTGVF